LEKVALISCGEYNPERIQQAVDRAVALIGGYESFIRPGMRVFIKPNLMRKSDPALCAVTHPSVVRALAKRAMELGASVIIGDSPGGVYNKAVLRGIYQAAGLEAVAAETGAALNYDCSEQEVDIPNGKYLKKLRVISPILEADLVINVCKLKSHGLAVYSGAVKNVYGVIPGLLKAELHFRFQSIEDFSDMVVDVCDFVRPALNIIDGVVAMEGEGPGSGDPRPVGAIVASRCPYSADLVATGLVGYEPEEIPMLAAALRRSLFDGKAEVTGEDPAGLRVQGFVRAVAAGNQLLRHRVPGILIRPLEKWFALKPRVRRKRCIGCGICAATCPVRTIRVMDAKARINPQSCIKCFCCMEFCPEKAIYVKRSWLFRAAIRLTGRREKAASDTQADSP